MSDASARPAEPLAAGNPPTTLPVPAVTGSTLIGCVYNSGPENGKPPGLAWCRLYDNPVYAWMVDASGVNRPIYPVILGTLPDWTPPPTRPVESPRWVVREGHMIYVPDVARGNANWFFNFMAFNNGAQRPLYADFSDVSLAGAWQAWVRINPGMALSENPMEGAPGIDPDHADPERRPGPGFGPAREA